MPQELTSLDTGDGRCDVSIFRPARLGPWPAVVLFMDGIGIRPALFEMGERLSQHGYYVLLPDLFHRAGSYTSPGARAIFSDPELRKSWFARFIGSTNPETVKTDTRACLDFLAAQPDVKQPKVGVTGYCMGGRCALAAAANFPDRVVVAASYHGGGLVTDAPDSPHLLVPRIKARVYVAGAVEDAGFTDAMKETLTDALAKAGVRHTVETYEGAKHGWVPTDTPVHDPAAAERHWQTLLALLDAELR